MEFNKDKVDDIVLALLYMGASKNSSGAQAWKAYDLSVLKRLHEKGWIKEPSLRSVTVDMTESGYKRSKELFEKHFKQ